jgi:hypothetical protein
MSTMMKMPKRDRSTLHNVNELMSQGRASETDRPAMWPWGADGAQQPVFIQKPSAREQEHLRMERAAFEKKHRMVKWGMTALAVCAALLYMGNSFAQDAPEAASAEKTKPAAKAATPPVAAKAGQSKSKAPSGPVEVMVAAAKEGKYPLPIKAMVSRGKGVTVLDVFDGGGGLVGFVLTAGNGEQRIYYVTQDGSTAIYGLAFDAQLNNMTAKHLASFTNPLGPKTSVGTLAPTAPPAAVAPATPAAAKPPAPSAPAVSKDDLWSAPTGAKNPDANAQPAKVDMGLPYNMAMKARGAFVEGKGLPVYIVFDLACPYCHKTYRATRDMLGQLEIHWIPVGALGPRSILLAETFLRSKDKSEAMASAVARDLKAADFSSPEVNQLLNENASILSVASVSNVPLILYSDHGNARHMLGAPSAAQLKELSRVAASNR